MDFADAEIAAAMREKHALLALLAGSKMRPIDTSSVPRRLAYLLEDPPSEVSERWVGYRYRPRPPPAVVVDTRHVLQAVRGVASMLVEGKGKSTGPNPTVEVKGDAPAVLMMASPPHAPPPSTNKDVQPHTRSQRRLFPNSASRQQLSADASQARFQTPGEVA